MNIPHPPMLLRASFLFAALSLLLQASLHADIPPASLIFETRLNSSEEVEPKNGATIGPDGSGVSGQPEDRSLVAQAGEEGPHALLTAEVKVSPSQLEGITITAWYKADSDIGHDSTLFNAFGSTLLWDDQRREWVLRLEPTTPPEEKAPMYWFFSGSQAGWAVPGEWVFIAMVWRKDGDGRFYHGSASAATELTREMTRDETVDSISERPESTRSIGGNARPPHRAFNGSIDNVRFFATALDQPAIEVIRTADLKNAPVTLP